MGKFKLIDSLAKKGYTAPKKKNQEEEEIEKIEMTEEDESEDKPKFSRLSNFFKKRGGVSRKLGVAKSKGKFKFGK